MDDRARRVTAVGQAGYHAATDAMKKIMDGEPLTDEEATATFSASLLWPAINYLVTIGATKEEALRFVATMYDQLEGESEEAAAQAN